jgi:EmrB/QacA subfamily drug resistance transporter
VTPALSTSAADKRVALLVATASSFLSPYMGTAVNVALPVIGAQFHLAAFTLSWVTTAYLLASVVCMVPLGRVADLYGRRRVFLASLWVYGIASLLCALAPSAAFLIGWRVLQGIGGSMIFVAGSAIVVSVFPQSERGRALGLLITSVYCGMSLGPVLGGLLAEHLGWRSIFFTTVPVAAATIALVIVYLRGEWVAAEREPFDVAGTVLYAAMYTALIFGLTLLPAARGAAFLAAGLGAVGLFVWREGAVAHPILDVRLFRTNRVFALSNLAALVNYSATYAVAFLLSLYLQIVRGLSPGHAGLIILVQPAVQAVSSPYAGRLADRVDARGPASLGMALTAAGLLLLGTLHDATSTAFIVASLAVAGAGFGLFSSPNTHAVMSAVEPRIYGVASSTLSTMRVTGQMLSMGIVTMILNAFIGDAAVTPALREPFVAATRTAFLSFGLLCAAGILPSLARGSARAPGAPEPDAA